MYIIIMYLFSLPLPSLPLLPSHPSPSFLSLRSPPSLPSSLPSLPASFPPLSPSDLCPIGSWYSTITGEELRATDSGEMWSRYHTRETKKMCQSPLRFH